MRNISFDLIRILSWPFLVFGLLSCQSDKPGQPDGWSIKAPLIKVADGDIGLTIAQASLVALDAEAYLEFMPDESVSRLEVESVCSFEGSMHSAKLGGKIPRRLPLRSLVPREIWQQPGRNRLEAARCSLHFHAENANGSTHRFEMPGLRFNREPLEAVTAGVLDLAVREEFPKFLERFTPLNIAALEKVSGERRIAVICDRFRNNVLQPSGMAILPAVYELFNGAVQGPELPLARRNLDSRQAMSRQTCRVVQESIDPESGFPTFLRSPSFTVDFPPALAKTEVVYKLNQFGHTALDRAELLAVRLSNETAHPISYRVPLTGIKIELQSVQRVRGQNFAGLPFSVQAEAEVSGGLRLRENSDYIDLQLIPGARASITLRIRSYLHCMSFWGADNRYTEYARVHKTGFYGLRYRLIEPWSILQYRNGLTPPFNHDPQPTTEAVFDAVAAATRERSERPLLNGFIPHLAAISTWGEGLEIHQPHIDITLSSTQDYSQHKVAHLCFRGPGMLDHPGGPEY